MAGADPLNIPLGQVMISGINGLLVNDINWNGPHDIDFYARHSYMKVAIKLNSGIQQRPTVTGDALSFQVIGSSISGPHIAVGRTGTVFGYGRGANRRLSSNLRTIGYMNRSHYQTMMNDIYSTETSRPAFVGRGYRRKITLRVIGIYNSNAGGAPFYSDIQATGTTDENRTLHALAYWK